LPSIIHYYESVLYAPSTNAPYRRRFKPIQSRVNRGLVDRGLLRLDDMLRPAIMSGLSMDVCVRL
jgi:hypothetical protein